MNFICLHPRILYVPNVFSQLNTSFKCPPLTAQIGGPSFHPLLDDDPEFQRFISANTDANHQMLDPDTCGYIQNPISDWIPRGHPIIDSYFIYQDFPVTDNLPSVPFNHPDPHDAYLNVEHMPKGHPSVSVLLREVLPDGHPDVNDLFFEELRELPSWPV